MSAVEMTRLALLKMYGAAPPVSLPNLPPLPGLPADILQQAQKQQEQAMNLHLQKQKSVVEDYSREAKEDRLRSEASEDEAIDTEEEVKEKSDHTSSVHNDNSLSPIPSKKRHRSTDSDDVEVSSPKKQQTLGLPGANIKIASRGKINCAT